MALIEVGEVEQNCLAFEAKINSWAGRAQDCKEPGVMLKLLTPPLAMHVPFKYLRKQVKMHVSGFRVLNSCIHALLRQLLCLALCTKRVAIDCVLPVKPGQTLNNQGLRFGSHMWIVSLLTM